MMKISVIIPIYKVEPYLRQCLDSVVNQTYKDLEIILIDDGSPDNCGKICDEFAERDKRIVVIHKKNGGLSAGWNDGIKVSSGDWLAFVDSDDWIDSLYFEELVKGISCADETEVVVANSYFEERGKTVKREMFAAPFLFQNGKGKECLQRKVFVAPDKTNGYDRLTVVWNKLYKASFVKKERILFDEKVRAGLGNDALFNFQILEKAKTVSGVIYAGYHYRILNTAGTRRFDSNRPEAAHYLMDRFYWYMNNNETSPDMWDAFEVYVFGNIIGNLQLCYFHAENKEEYRSVADKINQMKKMPRYRDAIYAKISEYLSWKQKIVKRFLQMPFIWPLKLYCVIKQHSNR